MTAALLAPPSARVAFNAYARIAEAWALTIDENVQLLGVSERTVYRILREGQREHISRDTLERISHLIAIYEGLAALFGPGEVAKTWVRRPNTDFGGRAPIERLCHGNVNDLVFVRTYLDRARQGW